MIRLKTVVLLLEKSPLTNVIDHIVRHICAKLLSNPSINYLETVEIIYRLVCTLLAKASMFVKLFLNK